MGDLVAICSCGYKGKFWHKHRETCLRHGHKPDAHKLVDAVPEEEETTK